jgi:ABC-2 type transport system ATP-binding protein
MTRDRSGRNDESTTAELLPAALTLISVGKRYGATIALDGVNLEVPAGSCFGLLGPNGAGKSTLIRAVNNLVDGVTGEIHVFGMRAGGREARATVGLAEQENNLDNYSTVGETLVLHGRLFGMSRQAARERAARLMDQFKLMDRRDTPAAELSGGERRRLVLARAVMHQPRLVILDEPTASVDVKRRAALWALMRQMQAGGATVLLTTHDLEEADALCDRVAFIEHGRVTARGPVPDLCARHHVSTLHQLYTKIIVEDR